MRPTQSGHEKETSMATKNNPFLLAARKAIQSGAGYANLRDDMAGHLDAYPGAEFIDDVYETGYRRGAESQALRVLTRLAAAAERAHAIRLLAALDEATTAIAAYTAPELAASIDNRVASLRCPWCGNDVHPHGDLNVVDTAMRNNRGSYDPRTQDQLVGVSDGLAEFHTLYLSTNCCGLPVRLPTDWEITWH